MRLLKALDGATVQETQVIWNLFTNDVRAPDLSSRKIKDALTDFQAILILGRITELSRNNSCCPH